MKVTQKRKLYIFLDEGGNFDFSLKGSQYFSITCVTTERPFHISAPLDIYRYDCIEYGLPQEYFHCAHDNNHVRKHMFGIISEHLQTIKIDSLLIEKCKVESKLQDPKFFYSNMLGYLIEHVINIQNKDNLDEVIVITDLIPINGKRKAVEKVVKIKLAGILSPNIRHKVLHHCSRAHYGLQVADYCNWAILRKWERGDTEHYLKIKSALRSEFDMYLAA